MWYENVPSPLLWPPKSSVMIFVLILKTEMCFSYLYVSFFMFCLFFSLYLLILSPLNSEYFGLLFLYIYIVTLYLPSFMLTLYKYIHIFSSSIEEKQIYCENVGQIEVVIDDIFLRDNGSKIFEIKCLILYRLT